MVLIVVLIAVAMLSLAGYGFAEWMLMERKAVQLYGDGLQAGYAAASGGAYLEAILAGTPLARRRFGGLVDNPMLFRGVQVSEELQTNLRCRFSVISPRLEEGRPAGFRFGVEDESARLDLRAVLAWDNRSPGMGRQALLQLPGMSVEIADAILDWTDVDPVPREFGAEADYYQSLPNAYTPRDGIPESLEELLLVRGVTRHLLLGDLPPDSLPSEETEADAQPTLVRPFNQPMTGTASGDPMQVSIPWYLLLTVDSAERNVRPDGQPRIDLNQEDLRKLHQQLRESLGGDWADFIVLYRQYGPYLGEPDPGPHLDRPIDFSVGGRFPIASLLDLVDAHVQLPSSSERPSQVVASPLSRERLALHEQLPRLLDVASLTADPILPGRININQAEPAVLQAVPGMDEGLVERIVAARQNSAGQAETIPGRRYATWLLTEGLVDLARMKMLLPYLNTGGDIFRAQVVGFFDSPGPTARIEIVIDATTNPPRILRHKDLSLLGPGSSRDVLGAEMDEVSFSGESAG
jgi:hypothetical protein